MRSKDSKILFLSMAIIISVLFIFIKATNNNVNNKPNVRSGDSISVTVDTPFLFSLLSDLSIGSNTDVYMADTVSKSTYNYSLYKDGKPSFEGIKKDVILYGENYLHDIDLTDYSNTDKKPPKLPIGYDDRDDELSDKNYYINPVNGKAIMENIYNDLGKHSSAIKQNYERLDAEFSGLFKEASNIGEDYEEPAIFFAGETYNIGWIQGLNNKIRVISLKDSKTLDIQDMYLPFIEACKKYDTDKILVDRELDEKIIKRIKKDLKDVKVIYLHQDEIYPKFIDFYKSNLDSVRNSLVNL